VWRLDRLVRSLGHLIEIVRDLHKRWSALPRPAGATAHRKKWRQLVFYLFGALAEFERDLIGERTQAGLVAARARGGRGGRRGLSEEKVRQLPTLAAGSGSGTPLAQAVCDPVERGPRGRPVRAAARNLDRYGGTAVETWWPAVLTIPTSCGTPSPRSYAVIFTRNSHALTTPPNRPATAAASSQ
jgi:Resolvase, N terminal domain